MGGGYLLQRAEQPLTFSTITSHFDKLVAIGLVSDLTLGTEWKGPWHSQFIHFALLMRTTKFHIIILCWRRLPSNTKTVIMVIFPHQYSSWTQTTWWNQKMNYLYGTDDLIFCSCHVMTFHAIAYPCESLSLFKEGGNWFCFQRISNNYWSRWNITEIAKIWVSISKLEKR